MEPLRQMESPRRAPKPVHSEKLCRRLSAHRTAAVHVELARNPVIALAVMMAQMIPEVFPERYGYGCMGRALCIQITCSHDRLLSNADDMQHSIAWQEIEAQRQKWAAMLPDDDADLLPWLLAQGEDVTSNLFAFCVAATVDGVSGIDGAHPVDDISRVLQLDLRKYWKPTRESYLDHVAKARIVEVVSAAVSPEAAASLVAMKKVDAAQAAELRLADTGWLPDMLRTPTGALASVSADEVREAA